MGWALVLTKSRTVWTSLLIGVSLFLMILQIKGWISQGMFYGVLAAGIVGYFLLTQLGGWSIIVQRMASLWDSGGLNLDMYSLSYRRRLWEGSLQAIAARPWGWGLGTFVHVFMQFAVHSDRFLVDYAHNEIFQVAVDLGVGGVLFLGAFILVYFKNAFVFLGQKNASRNDKVMATGFLSSLVVLLAISMFDFPLRIHSTGLLFAIFLGMNTYLYESALGLNTSATSEPIRRKFSWNSLALRGASCCIVIALGVVTTRQLQGQLHYRKGFKYEKIFKWEKARMEYEKAILSAPQFNEYYEALGRLYRKKSAITIQKEQKIQFREKSIEAFKQAIKHHPYWPASYYVLAQLYRKHNDVDQAKANYEKAVSLNPMNSRFAVEYGRFALEQGDLEKALDLFEQYQKIPFKENTVTDPCEILGMFSPYTQSQEDLRRLVSNQWQDHLCLGYVFGENKAWDAAKTEFDIAMKRARAIYDYEQFIKTVGSKIADFYRTHDRFKDAINIYEAALRRNPKDPFAKSKRDEIFNQIEILNEVLLTNEPSLLVPVQTNI